MTKAYRMIRFLSIPHDKEHVSMPAKGSVVVMSSINATWSPGYVYAHLEGNYIIFIQVQV